MCCLPPYSAVTLYARDAFLGSVGTGMSQLAFLSFLVLVNPGPDFVEACAFRYGHTSLHIYTEPDVISGSYNYMRGKHGSRHNMSSSTL
jgi:hypothetical protein